MRNKKIKIPLETNIGGVNFFEYPLVDNILLEAYSFVVIDRICILDQRRVRWRFRRIQYEKQKTYY